MREPLLIRADASADIGLGHAMRCLALAESFLERRGGAATFLMASPPPAFASRAAAAGVEIRSLAAAPGSTGDVRETLAIARAAGAGWIVLDGYQFDGSFQHGLAAGGRRVLALDDYGHARSYHADLVLNQNAGAEALLYADREPATRLLLGPRFALLRTEFREWSRHRSIPVRARRLVITLGGGDADNVTALVLEAMGAVSGPLDLLLIIGAANPHRAALEKAAASCPHPIEVAVDVTDMPRRLAWADLAIAGTGSTALELACLGTPQVGIVLAENQWPGGAALARDGHVVCLGWHADLDASAIAAAVTALAADAERRAELSRRGCELVDGRGALRVIEAMQRLGESRKSGDAD